LVAADDVTDDVEVCAIVVVVAGVFINVKAFDAALDCNVCDVVEEIF